MKVRKRTGPNAAYEKVPLGPFVDSLSNRDILKVHIFSEGHKILRNLHQLYDWQYIEQIIGGDFAKFCGLLRIYF